MKLLGAKNGKRATQVEKLRWTYFTSKLDLADLTMTMQVFLEEYVRQTAEFFSGLKMPLELPRFLKTASEEIGFERTVRETIKLTEQTRSCTSARLAPGESPGAKVCVVFADH